MKFRRFPIGLALVAAGGFLLESAQGQPHYRRAQYNYAHPRPAASTNQHPATAQPAEKPVKFRDLPLNAEFYFMADKDRKLFPRIKISSVAAKTVPTAASPTVSTNPIPAETLVIMKPKEEPKKDKPKPEEPKHDGDKKEPPHGGKDEGKNPPA